MFDRLHVLWRHYSSWCLYALIALGGLQEFAPALADYLPRWVLVATAFAALAAKLIPQDVRRQLDAEQAAREYAEHQRMAGKATTGRVEE